MLRFISALARAGHASPVHARTVTAPRSEHAVTTAMILLWLSRQNVRCGRDREGTHSPEGIEQRHHSALVAAVRPLHLIPMCPKVTEHDAEPSVYERLKDGSFSYFSRSGRMGGFRFHAYDVVIADGRVRRVRAASPEATHRVFVQPDAEQWIYRFAAGEDRRLAKDALDRQFAASSFSPRDVAKTSMRGGVT